MPPSKYLLLSACVSGYVLSFERLLWWEWLSQLSVDVECLVCFNLHLSYAVTRCDPLALLYRGFKFIAPRAPPAITISVIVTAQKVTLRPGALFDGERNINGFKEVFSEVGVQAYKVVDVLLDILRVQAAEEVAVQS